MNGITGNASVDAVYYAMGSKWACAYAWLITINLFFAGVSSVAVTARITWALSRDNGIPFSDYLKEVHPDLKSPIRAIMFVFVIDAILQLLPLNEAAGLSAFYSIVGLCSVGFQVSYAIPIMCHCIWSDKKTFPVTPSSLGKYSKYMGVFAFTWLYGTSCLFFFPSAAPVTQDSMNWLIVVVTIVFVIGVVNRILNSSKSFTGPKRTAADNAVAAKSANNATGELNVDGNTKYVEIAKMTSSSSSSAGDEDGNGNEPN